MTPSEAVNRLRPALAPEGSDTFRFASRKVFLSLKLFDIPVRLRFTAKDRVLFRIDERDFIVADSKTGVICKQFGWGQIESMAAGEPESDNGILFQG